MYNDEPRGTQKYDQTFCPLTKLLYNQHKSKPLWEVVRLEDSKKLFAKSDKKGMGLESGTGPFSPFHKVPQVNKNYLEKPFFFVRNWKIFGRVSVLHDVTHFKTTNKNYPVCVQVLLTAHRPLGTTLHTT